MVQESIENTPQGLQASNGSPRAMYTFFLLSLMKSYFEAMRGNNVSPEAIEGATMALISFCPNLKKRTEMWQKFDLALQADPDTITRASAMIVGELISYLSDLLDFEEEAVAGW